MSEPAEDLLRAIFAAPPKPPGKCCPWCPADYSDPEPKKRTWCDHRRRCR